MKVYTGTLHLTTITVLIALVESICSEATTLEELFPGFNGVLPPLETFLFGGQLPEFDTFGNKHIKSGPADLVKRGHIIFAGRVENFMHDLYLLFDDLKPAFFVFDMNKDEWITVHLDLSRKLGANRYVPLVVARDEAASKHSSTSNNPVYKRAHILACRYANDRVDIVELEQFDLMVENQTTMDNIVGKIKEEYSQAYDREFTRCLYQHGEYSLNGHRERSALGRG